MMDDSLMCKARLGERKCGTSGTISIQLVVRHTSMTAQPLQKADAKVACCVLEDVSHCRGTGCDPRLGLSLWGLALPVHPCHVTILPSLWSCILLRQCAAILFFSQAYKVCGMASSSGNRPDQRQSQDPPCWCCPAGHSPEQMLAD